jgi:RHS repeat-associated protein
LVEAETDNCSGGGPITDEWFSYDANGRQTDMWESTPHSAGYYHTAAAYFANGALQSLGGIPGYTAITYGLDGEGRLSTAQQGTSKIVCDPSCSFSSTTYDASGQPLVVNIGGTTDNDTYTYSPYTGLMNTFAFTVGSTPKSLAGTLTWNPNGTLGSLAITDGFNSGGSQTCNYGTSTVVGYDDLGRLVSANCVNSSNANVWGQNFSYDQYDNLTKTVPPGATGITWNPGYNSGTNQYTLAGTSYDSSGNLLNDTFHTYTWDGNGHVSTVDSTACGTNGKCLTYDALGRLVEESSNTNYTETLYSPVGRVALMNGQAANSAFFPLPGGESVYEVGSTGGAKYFQHKDWLGSARFASSIANRSLYYDLAYAPYGEAYDKFGTNAGDIFAGDTQDTIPGTYDTLNRELNPSQGRWLSPDPAGAGWNRYA